jgi:hypothetical protein
MKFKAATGYTAVALCIAGIAVTETADAQTVSITASPIEAGTAHTYWTPERMAKAKPMEARAPAGFAPAPLESAPAVTGAPVSTPGSAEPGDPR